MQENNRREGEPPPRWRGPRALGSVPVALILAILVQLAMVQVWTASPARAGSVIFMYDDYGRLAELVYDDGKRVRYNYDAAGNRTSMVNDFSFDGDGDGMSDVFEIEHGLDPDDPSDAGLDPDGDGLDNLGEFQAGSDPNNPDSDGDGTLDGADSNPAFNDGNYGAVLELLILD